MTHFDFRSTGRKLAFGETNKEVKLNYDYYVIILSGHNALSSCRSDFMRAPWLVYEWERKGFS